MTEESPQSFPQPNQAGLIYAYIKSKLEKAEITLQRIDMDILNNTCTVTTDKKVPEQVMSNVREHVASKGITIKFLTSG